MTDNEAGPSEPVRSQPAGGSARSESLVRWVVWIAVTVVTVGVFADLLIRH